MYRCASLTILVLMVSLLLAELIYAEPLQPATQRAVSKTSKNPRRENVKRPNLLVITFDTTRADRLEPYGFTAVRTPAITRLAREGITFEHCASQSPQTLPSHASLFTGLYTLTHDVRSNGQKLEDDVLTLAERLSAEGYETGAVVATAALLSAFNLSQGFATYNDNFEDSALEKAFKSFLRFFSRHKINLYSTRSADRVAALGKKWLNKAAAQEKPFFLWLHFFDPHDPYVFHPNFERPDLVREEGKPNRFGVPEENYLNEIEFADHYLGKILDHLDAQQMADNTLVVFTADHGESLGEHDYVGHREEVYESIIRIPLIMRLPGQLPDGQRSRIPSMSIDVTPTILSLLGISYPEEAFTGRNLFDLDEETPRQRYSLAVKLFTKSPIRTALYYGDHKFIRFDDSDSNLCFNLSSDPLEKLNLLRQSQEPDIQIDWLEEIAQWVKQHEQLGPDDFEMTDEQLEKLRSLGYVQG